MIRMTPTLSRTNFNVIELDPSESDHIKRYLGFLGAGPPPKPGSLSLFVAGMIFWPGFIFISQLTLFYLVLETYSKKRLDTR